MNKLSVESLLTKYLTGSITEEEKWLLNEMLQEPEHCKQLETIIDNELHEYAFEGEADDSIFRLIQDTIKKRINSERRAAKTIWLSVRRIAVAAVFILLLGAGTYWLFQVNKRNDRLAEQKNVPLTNDVPPGDNRAILKLADGTQIILDSAEDGTLAKQGSVKIIKLNNGQLSYNSSTEKPKEVLYNTITVPKGGQYQLKLADGTRVWINAASSLRFPAFFNSGVRNVELTGEAYFEVAKNASMPFHVTVKALDIQVLGTHFNVNAYENEVAISTTLIEGSVKVSKAGQSRQLEPGQQAAAKGNDQIQVLNNVDLEEVLAWKNGLFQFNSADVEIILRQAGRWYNVEFEYSDNIKERFTGQIPRNVNLSQLLKILESTGKVQFNIQGRKVIVKS